MLAEEEAHVSGVVSSEHLDSVSQLLNRGGVRRDAATQAAVSLLGMAPNRPLPPSLPLEIAAQARLDVVECRKMRASASGVRRVDDDAVQVCHAVSSGAVANVRDMSARAPRRR